MADGGGYMVPGDTLIDMPGHRRGHVAGTFFLRIAEDGA